ncbi:DMT family transporter [Tateyamaria omphalii]|uniref:DMT family transporter n=1 Tax=Tateyamaria omphalii TaxID=299262 RepID=UPI00167AC33D|nr:DMT family transporter [Tateyamaria omphalii]
MALNIVALSIVKALGLDYPAIQLVFLRAIIGLGVMAPFLWRDRQAFSGVDRLPLHALRVILSTLALTTSFFAIAHLPFALFTAIGFTRPIITMLLALLLLKEVVPRRRWWAAGLAFAGVYVAVDPALVTLNSGLPAAFLTVLFGTTAIILTRTLANTPVIVMMVFYTGGLAILAAPFAIATWASIASDHLVPLLAIGLFAQCAQFCFLQAHFRAEAAFLSVLGYLSLVISTAVGYFIFSETPTVAFAFGAGLIILAAAWTTLSR